MVQHAVILLERQARTVPVRILDMGTGSGCILLALLRALPQATGLGIDKSSICISLACKNAYQNNLQERASFAIGTWAIRTEEKFDLVISNPPRVATKDISFLMPEMRDHDPIEALDGGPDGLSAFRSLADNLSCLLKPDGYALFQVGSQQIAAVQKIFKKKNFNNIEIRHNYAHMPNCLMVST